MFNEYDNRYDISATGGAWQSDLSNATMIMVHSNKTVQKCDMRGKHANCVILNDVYAD